MHEVRCESMKLIKPWSVLCDKKIVIKLKETFCNSVLRPEIIQNIMMDIRQKNERKKVENVKAYKQSGQNKKYVRIMYMYVRISIGVATTIYIERVNKLR